MAGSGRGESVEFVPAENPDEFEVMVRMAEVLRREFGVGIDAHPGGPGSEAGTINRAYRPVARVVLNGVVPPAERSVVLTRALRRAAEWRLSELDVVGDDAQKLLDSEPKLGEAWLAYLALASEEVIDDLTKSGR